MSRRAVCTVLAALLVLQSVTFVALASVAAAAVVTQVDHPPCDSAHSAPDVPAECPCCPDGSTSMGTCSGTCAVQASAVAGFMPAVFSAKAVTPGFDPVSLPSLAHLPPLPPPIA
jgi:hypothetical protein